MKLNTLYVESYKFYWLNLQRKVQIFVGSMTDFHNVQFHNLLNHFSIGTIHLHLASFYATKYRVFQNG